jgi:L-alanine-DL-glutamate epimerase-like enolase superfamily enzyme
MNDGASIQSVDAEYYQVPLDEPLYDARHGVHTHFELVIAKVKLADGSQGVGYTYTGGKGGRAIYEMIVHDLAPALVGKQADEIEELWDFMNWHIHYVGRGGISSFAIAAVDIALWDLRAKRAEQPLWKVLGGDGKKVKTYAGLIDLNYSLDQHKEVIDQKLAEGHRGIKIKIGLDDLDADIKRTRAVRDLIPQDVAFMVDANMKWDAETAIEMGKAMFDLDVVWFEEPVLPDDFQAFEQVGQAIDIPLAQGENLHTLLEFRSALETGVLAFPEPDASNIGGITGWVKVAKMCQEKGLPVSTHGMQELHVSLLAGMPNAGYMEMHSFPIDRYTTRPMMVEDGYVTPPEYPGCGVVFDWDVLVEYRG